MSKIDHMVNRWEAMGKRGVTVSVCFGPCGDLGMIYSVDAIGPNGETFEKPYGAQSLDKALQIAEKEALDRGWIPRLDSESLALFRDFDFLELRCWIPRLDSESLLSRIRRALPHWHRWKVTQLVNSKEGLVYTVRDCRCGRREILNRFSRRWTEESQTQFSLLKCFEEDSRKSYLEAKLENREEKGK